ncbi:MAG: lamin tail domain-containing protein [Clostridiales bacterium]|nr:lamin tail domain-containing protein [Clostridiales bacterium]
MQNPQTNRHRRGQTYTQTAEKPAAVKRRQKIRRVGNAMAMLILLSVVVLLVIVCPKEPVRHAYYTIATGADQAGTTGASSGMYQGLVISEVMASNRSAFPDENGEYPDWVEIWNSSENDIDMENVGLSDDDLSIKFLFPKMTLKAGERVVVYCDTINQANAGKPLHAKFKLSSNGETVTLYDPIAYVIDSVKTPILSANESYARMEDGKWAKTNEYSPGYENTTEGYLTFRNATMVTDGALIISEICPDPLTGYRDEDGELTDWVELYNTTGEIVYLNNYALSDNEDKPLKWRFPEGACVAPYGYYIVYCSGKDIDNGPTGISHTNFKISAEHDTILLSDSRGRLVDRVTLDNIPEDASYARDEDGNFSVHVKMTPMLPNTSSGEHQMDVYLRALNETGVYITEVMASNDDVATTAGATFTDWIEIYNASAEVVDLSGYGLSDNISRARKWQFPAGTLIMPGEYKLIQCDGDTEANTAAQLHASFRLTKAGGYSVVLADPTGKILDKLVLPEVPTNVSYGRTTGREGFFYYDAPTPGTLNGDGFLGYADKPELSVQGGMYRQGLRVSMTIPEDATVYYTTDGSEPNMTTGQVYNGQELELYFTTVLRAKAFPVNPAYKASETATTTYFINTYHDVPVVSVIVEPDLLWNEEYGLLADGPNIIKDKPGGYPWKGATYRKVKEASIPYEGYMEYYDLDDNQVFSQGIDISLSGAYSLDMPQKSMKVRAKAKYGEKTFAAALFEDRPFTEYKSLVLRNSGNDSAWTRLLDGFQSRLMDAYGVEVLHQAWKPVAVYINGVYWGHMNLRERVDRYFVAQHEGLSLEEADNMDILVANGTVEYGSNKEFKAMVNKLKTSDPANNPEDRAYLDANVDVENLLEYMAVEMFFGNSDIGNTRFYRLHGIDPETGERYKWKWILYDLDYGMFNSGFNSPRSYTKATGMGDKNINNTCFLTALKVPEYKDMFLRKLGDIFQTFTTEFMTTVLEECVAELHPDTEMKLHFARWAEYHDQMVVSEWPTTYTAAYTYWQNRIKRLRDVTIQQRPHKLWQMVKDQFKLTDAQMLEYFGPQPPLEAE